MVLATKIFEKWEEDRVTVDEALAAAASYDALVGVYSNIGGAGSTNYFGNGDGTKNPKWGGLSFNIRAHLTNGAKSIALIDLLDLSGASGNNIYYESCYWNSTGGLMTIWGLTANGAVEYGEYQTAIGNSNDNPQTVTLDTSGIEPVIIGGAQPNNTNYGIGSALNADMDEEDHSAVAQFATYKHKDATIPTVDIGAATEAFGWNWGTTLTTYRVLAGVYNDTVAGSSGKRKAQALVIGA